ncbi:MAG: tRNA (adenosine(37)-N6)-threonylcarbamoyltransferase complex dimerization subunit type 1 TsaB [Elusimicrobiota bacterium]|jgi:tRNA threonylcarbamoyladenosine biosynthesis protein TsaB|nr:tRNA (adenosine(37)-N6)-threonylcarbamoyltransferase complex dimerization subunit type 1 TsaB [Elusimicrobiota bacterium]
MKILSVETTGQSFSAALAIDEKIIADVYYDCGLIHSEKLLTVIKRILEDTNTALESIDKFAVSKGPGSFTGIRVGMTAVKTIAQCLNKPVSAYDSLQILQASMPEIKGVKIVPLIDALRNEVYIKRKNDIVIKTIEKAVGSLKKYKKKIIIIGNAAIAYKTIIEKELGKTAVSLEQIFHTPKAKTLAALAFKEPGQNYSKISPLYIRRSWAEEQKNKDK